MQKHSIPEYEAPVESHKDMTSPDETQPKKKPFTYGIQRKKPKKLRTMADKIGDVMNVTTGGIKLKTESPTMWPDDLKLPCSIAVVSKRNSGKTVLLDGLLSRWIASGATDAVMILSATILYNKDYAHVRRLCSKHDVYCHFDEFDPSYLETIVSMQQGKIESPKKFKNITVVLDDVIGSMDKSKGKGELSAQKFVNSLFTLSRHHKITIVLSTQRAMGVLSPTIRQNTDYCIMSQVNTENEKALADITNSDRYTIHHVRNQIDKKPFTFALYDNLAPHDGRAELSRWSLINVTPPKSAKSDDDIKKELANLKHKPLIAKKEPIIAPDIEPDEKPKPKPKRQSAEKKKKDPQKTPAQILRELYPADFWTS